MVCISFREEIERKTWSKFAYLQVCISNIPRQLVALNKTVSHPKVDVMKERILAINPECSVTAIQDFAMPNNLDQVNLIRQMAC